MKNYFGKNTVIDIFQVIWRRFCEWFGEHCPVHIPTRKPECPKSLCPGCDKPYTKIIAIDTGDGWVFEWSCENDCGDTEPIIGWYPFCFGAWCNSRQLERIGIEVV